MAKYDFTDRSREELYGFFHVDYPRVGAIRKRYKGKFIDLNKETYLDNKTVAEAVVEAAKKGKALYIPEEYPMWDEKSIFSKKFHGEKVSFEISTPYKFKKFGPEININTTKMRVGEARETNFHKLMYEKLSEKKNRELMLEGTRGLGYWRPQHKDHVIILWHVFSEGYGYANQKKLGGGSIIKSRLTDARVWVPSLTKGQSYDIQLLNLPVHEKDDIYNLEVFQTEWRGSNCEDVIYREFSGRVTEDELKIIAMKKYAKPEHVPCKHRYTAEFSLFMNPDENKPKMQILRYPKPHLFSSKVFNVLKRKTIVGDEKRGERPTKAAISSAYGMVMGLEGPDAMFKFNF